MRQLGAQELFPESRTHHQLTLITAELCMWMFTKVPFLKLQLVHNAAACLLSRTCYRDHTHPVGLTVVFKILLFVLKAHHGLASVFQVSHSRALKLWNNLPLNVGQVFKAQLKIHLHPWVLTQSESSKVSILLTYFNSLHLCRGTALWSPWMSLKVLYK